MFIFLATPFALAQDGIPALPAHAKLAFTEDWSGGKIDRAKWYVLRKKWGAGNHGVVPENVRIERDSVRGTEQHVLVCEAHGDQYDGPVVGLWGRKDRVGGVIVSKPFFASGRFEVVMKIGGTKSHAGGPEDPRRPKGTVPAIWTFAYRYVEVGKERMKEFVAEKPLYNPHMERYGNGSNEYWSELDFPEFGKGGVFEKAMYNTFLQNQHEPKLYDVTPAIDGDYHTYTTEWRTKLEPFPGLTDAQTIEHAGFWWIKDKAVPFHKYWGNPLKRVAKDDYQLYCGDKATHWLDGKPVAENAKFVPAMAAQLNLGVWLPDWAGAAPWKTARISFAAVKVWQYSDAGDVRGILTDDIGDNFDKSGQEMKK